MRDTTDILISGGGIAGLTAAVAFAQAGFRVICVDPQAPVTTATDDQADLRTTAFLQPARKLLDDIGLWPRLQPFAAPLQIMRIIDAGGKAPEARFTADFDAADISDQPFGWNLPNWLLRREFAAHVAGLPNVDFRPGIGTTALLARDSQAIVTLTDGTRIDARLVIAADGRNSAMRDAAGLRVTTTRYGQKALAFAVTHPIPHGNISTEVHRSGGPFTLVPLPDRDGEPASAVVWMDHGPEIQSLAVLPQDAFEVAMTERSTNVLGPLTLASRRTVWPIISQIADRLDGPRVALMAEAAHVVPPIGAQGLNMSLADLSCLLTLAADAPDRLGDRDMLTRYHRTRWPDIRARVTGIDALNRAAIAGAPALRDLRGGLLRLLHDTAPVRRTLMQAGLGIR